MKRLLIPIIGALALGAALPVAAGPDFQAIEQARKAKQSTLAGRQADVSAMGAPGARPQKCPPGRLVLPLDHGPRAQTTPSENQKRKARHEARVKACMGAAG